MASSSPSDGEPVSLYIYDLSNGMAKQWGPMLGVNVQGIWHTSLVLYGMEVFYGQGIDIVSPPGTTHHGQPMQKLSVGKTHLDRDTFLAYIQGIRETWTADKYHLLEFNCNSFTQDVLTFLNGRSIPQEIVDLPRTVLATPFGQQMRPMIDQMFRGAGAGPDARQAVRSMLPDDTPSQQSVVSNLAICTSPASLRAILERSKAVAVMFTSASCPPCRTIKPVFEDLAKAHGAKTNHERVEFAIVDVAVGLSSDIARDPLFGGPVQATPTFVFFSSGTVLSHCKGANPRELETQVAALINEAYPAHPHNHLYLPRIQKLTHSLAPITYPTFPALPALATKLESNLAKADLEPTHVQTLSQDVFGYLTSLPPPPTPPSQSIPAGLIDRWTDATLRVMDTLPPTSWFPIMDLVRLALARDHKRLSLDRDFNSRLVPGVLERATSSAVLDKADKALLLTTVKLASNALAAPALVHHVLESSTRLVVQALLFTDKTVRSAGAGLAWSVVGRIWAATQEQGSSDAGLSDEERQVEIASAVLEALGREEESPDVVHRLVASSGLLMYKSPHHEAINGLLQVLDVQQVLERAAKMLTGSAQSSTTSADALSLVNEVKKLCV